jgi:hypothetical protein
MISPNLAFLQQILLKCPITGERQTIERVHGAEEGLDYLEITTRGKTTAWIHKISSEETKIDP